MPPKKTKEPPSVDAGEPSGSEPKTKKAKKTKVELPEIIPQDEAPRQVLNDSRKDSSPFKAVSWNVAGLRALMDKNPQMLRKIVDTEQPDVIALQEHKLQEQHVADLIDQLKVLLPEYPTVQFTCSTVKKGYSGVAVLCKAPLVGSNGSIAGQNSPLKQSKQPSVASFFGGAKTETKEDEKVSQSTTNNSNYSGPSLLSITPGFGDFKVGYTDEGRVLTLEFGTFFCVFTYVPNSGQKLERLEYRLKNWDLDFRNYLQYLDEKKPVVLGGDLNVGHLDIDIYNVDAAHIKKIAGLTPEERQSFSETLSELKFVDSFRKFHPEKTGWFSYWSGRAGNRPKNRGLRLDYFVTSERLDVVDGFILDRLTVGASDHAPLGVTVRVP